MNTRDEVRAAFAEAGLDYSILSQQSLKALRRSLDTEMKKSGLIDGSFRMRRTCRLRMRGTRPFAELRCRSHYFDNREAVTFGPDGFIGFAGWADDRNIQPILAGFRSWMEGLTTCNRIIPTTPEAEMQI